MSGKKNSSKKNFFFLIYLEIFTDDSDTLTLFNVLSKLFNPPWHGFEKISKPLIVDNQNAANSKVTSGKYYVKRLSLILRSLNSWLSLCSLFSSSFVCVFLILPLPWNTKPNMFITEVVIVAGLWKINLSSESAIAI